MDVANLVRPWRPERTMRVLGIGRSSNLIAAVKTGENRYNREPEAGQ